MDKWKSKQRTEAPPLSRLKSPLNEEGNIDPDDELAKVAPEFIMWVHKTHKVRETLTHLVFDLILEFVVHYLEQYIQTISILSSAQQACCNTEIPQILLN